MIKVVKAAMGATQTAMAKVAKETMARWRRVYVWQQVCV